MPRVVFTESFNWHVKPNVTVHHKAGAGYLVTQACADAAISAGKAVADTMPEMETGQRRRKPDDASR